MEFNLCELSSSSMDITRFEGGPNMEVDLKPLEVNKRSRAFSEAIMEGKINVG
jgi:hypothetical protein